MMESHIKLVIFDLDGTLVDSLAELVAAANYVHSVFGLPCLTNARSGNAGQRWKTHRKILPKPRKK